MLFPYIVLFSDYSSYDHIPLYTGFFRILQFTLFLVISRLMQ